MFAIVLAVLLIGFCWAFGHLSLLPASLVLVLDSLATAFRWIGVTDPATGWLLLGVVGGAAIGAFVGLRRAGRAVTGRNAGRVSAVVAAAMLVAGNRLPERTARTVEQSTPTRPPTATRHMYVATEHASVRTSPVAGATVIAQLPGRSRLDVLRASDDGAWWYVEGRRGSRTVTGWVRRSALADGIPITPPDEVAPPPTAVAQQAPRADTVGGEVTLSRPAPAPRVDSGTPVRGSAPVGAPVARPSGGFGPAEQPADRPAEPADRSVVADVQTRLTQARAGVAGNDFAAALRALAAADESIVIAGAKYADASWLSTLRREATTVRASTRASCQAASAQATARGEAPPRCE